MGKDRRSLALVRRSGLVVMGFQSFCVIAISILLLLLPDIDGPISILASLDERGPTVLHDNMASPTGDSDRASKGGDAMEA